MAAFELFATSDGVESCIGLQQRNDFAIPALAERVFSGSATPCRVLRSLTPALAKAIWLSLLRCCLYWRSGSANLNSALGGNSGH